MLNLGADARSVREKTVNERHVIDRARRPSVRASAGSAPSLWLFAPTLKSSSRLSPIEEAARARQMNEKAGETNDQAFDDLTDFQNEAFVYVL